MNKYWGVLQVSAPPFGILKMTAEVSKSDIPIFN